MDQDYIERMLQQYEDKMFRDEERWLFGDDDEEEDLEYRLEQAEYWEER